MSALAEVVICTRNRPRDLESALRSCARHSPQPRVLVVDSSDGPETEALVGSFAAEGIGRGMTIRYLRSARGLTVQRMNGIAHLSPGVEIVHFIDDDVEVEPDYFCEIEAVLEDRRDVAAVGGVVSNVPAHTSRWLRRFFLLDGRTPGAVLASGINITGWGLEHALEVDWLSGCCMSYRTRVFDVLSFDTRLPLVAIGEDVDFGFRVSRLAPIVITPRARVRHNCSPVERMGASQQVREETRHRYVWVCEMRGLGVSIPAFLWSLFGQILLGIALAVLTLSRSSLLSVVQLVRGFVDGLLEGVPERSPRLRGPGGARQETPSATKPTVGVVIPTRNRPGELERCLRALCAQSEWIVEIVVSDSSDDSSAIEEVCRSLRAESSRPEIRYLRARKPSATSQRNEGIDALALAPDFVLFMDDDAFAHDGYLRALLDEIVSRGPRCLGVSGITVPGAALGKDRFRALEVLFLLEPLHRRGQILASGVNSAPPREGLGVTVQWLNGCALYRSWVLVVIRFAEVIEGYALCDDADFAARVGMLGDLVVTPSAVVTHEPPASGERLGAVLQAKAGVVNRHWFLSRQRPGLARRLAFWWSVAGLVLLYSALSLRSSRHREHLAGVLEGIGAIFRGEVCGVPQP